MLKKVVSLVIVMLMSMLSSVACMSQAASPTAPATTVPTVLIPTSTALPTNTFAPTATNTSVSQASCTYPNWPIYTVVSGDTLGNIAQRTGSTVASLVSANCLSSPDSLVVGQKLRVPSIPATQVSVSSTTCQDGSGKQAALFPAGATSATVSESLPFHGVDTWTFHAAAGQVLSGRLDVSSGKVDIAINGVSQTVSLLNQQETTTSLNFQQAAPSTQDYNIVVGSSFNGCTTYSLTVNLTNVP